MASALVAEGHILLDTIDIGRPDERSLSQRATALRLFALEQMASSSASTQDFAGARYLEALGNRLFGFNPLGASHP